MRPKSDNQNKKVKICHVIGDFVNGGVESIIYNYFTHMDLSKFEVHIIAHGIKVKDCYDRFEKLGFKLYNITPKKENLIKSINEMNKIFKENQYDIVHSHLTEWASIPMILGRKNNVKVRINHSHMAEFPSGVINKMYYGIRKYLGKKFSTDYFACGVNAGVYLFGKAAYDTGKITIINNAIDVPKFQYSDEVRKQVRNELRIGDKICFGHVGRFFEQKNHEFLIDVFNEVHKLNNNTLLMLVGDGELRESIEKRIANYGLKDSVIILGVREDVNLLFQAMDVFALPSLFEGLPVVAIEAQVAGLPCVVSDKITNEICITDSIKMLPLDNNHSNWAKTMLSLAEKERQELDIEYLNKYDIEINAKKLESFYLATGGNNCE